MQLETGTKKLEKEVEHLLEQIADLNQREGAAQLHEVVKSQTERQTLNTEQDKFVKLRQHYLSSNLAHPSWDKQPDQPRQQEQNGEPNQEDTIVSSEAETAFRE
jgi:UDP-N-acetylglucosamine pyrophosphorylase